MKAFFADRRGDAVIEFAWASIVFFATLFGILEFGQAVWRYNVVANLAKEGVRRAMVCGSGTSLSSTDCNILSYLQGRSMGLTICNTCVTVTPSTLSSMRAGDTVTVRVQHTFTPLPIGLIPHPTMTFSSTSSMIVSR